MAACLVQTLISYLHAWGIPENDLVLEPLLRPHNQHYSGVLFQVHLLASQDSGVTSLLAVGRPGLMPYPAMSCRLLRSCTAI